MCVRNSVAEATEIKGSVSSGSVFLTSFHPAGGDGRQGGEAAVTQAAGYI